MDVSTLVKHEIVAEFTQLSEKEREERIMNIAEEFNKLIDNLKPTEKLNIISDDVPTALLSALISTELFGIVIQLKHYILLLPEIPNVVKSTLQHAINTVPENIIADAKEEWTVTNEDIEELLKIVSPVTNEGVTLE